MAKVADVCALGEALYFVFVLLVSALQPRRTERLDLVDVAQLLHDGGVGRLAGIGGDNELIVVVLALQEPLDLGDA